MEPQSHLIFKQAPNNVRDLYDKYAGMLLGYLVEVIKDRMLAEQYLVTIYNNLPQHLQEINREDTNTWCQLKRFAKSQLAGLHEPANGSSTALNYYSTRNRFLNQMTEEQKLVFCNIYYHGKTTAALSQELNKTEDTIRKALKEAFAIIRRGRGEN